MAVDMAFCQFHSLPLEPACPSGQLRGLEARCLDTSPHSQTTTLSPRGNGPQSCCVPTPSAERWGLGLGHRRSWNVGRALHETCTAGPGKGWRKRKPEWGPGVGGLGWQGAPPPNHSGAGPGVSWRPYHLCSSWSSAGLQVWEPLGARLQDSRTPGSGWRPCRCTGERQDSPQGAEVRAWD